LAPIYLIQFVKYKHKNQGFYTQKLKHFYLLAKSMVVWHTRKFFFIGFYINC